MWLLKNPPATRGHPLESGSVQVDVPKSITAISFQLSFLKAGLFLESRSLLGEPVSFYRAAGAEFVTCD